MKAKLCTLLFSVILFGIISVYSQSGINAFQDDMVITVSPKGQGDWVKLSQAIESLNNVKSPEKYIIKLMAGEHSENLKIDKPVKIIGDDNNEKVEIVGNLTFVEGGEVVISNCNLKGKIEFDIQSKDIMIEIANNRFVNSDINIKVDQIRGITFLKKPYCKTILNFANNILHSSNLYLDINYKDKKNKYSIIKPDYLQLSIRNNIFAQSSRSLNVNIEGNISEKKIVCEVIHNIFYKNVSAISSQSKQIEVVFNNFWANNSASEGAQLGLGNTFIDPNFVNIEKWDFRTREILLLKGGKEGGKIGLISDDFPNFNSTNQPVEYMTSKPISIDLEGRFNEDVANIPKSKAKRPNAFAVIIGMPDAKNALNDAILMEAYFREVFGINEKNIIRITQSTLGRNDIIKFFRQELLKAINSQTDLYVYYSGHGVTDEAGNTYILPTDGDPNPALVPALCYSFTDLYEALNNLNAQNVTVIIDACFSGTDKENQPLYYAAKGQSKPEIREAYRTYNNFIVITSSAGNQTSRLMLEMDYSLFTYYFAAALKGFSDIDQNGKITLNEIIGYVVPNVESYSYKVYGTKQTPTFWASDGDFDRVIIKY